jgi:hypothetical protein
VYSIGVAFSIVFLYLTVKKQTAPPKTLRHIPHVNFFRNVKMMIQGKPYAHISKQLVMPLLHREAVGYLKMDSLGWTLHLTDPVAAKEFFLKTGRLTRK